LQEKLRRIIIPTMTTQERGQDKRQTYQLAPKEERIFGVQERRRRFQTVSGVISLRSWFRHSEGAKLGPLISVPVGEFFWVGGQEIHISNYTSDTAEYRELREIPRKK